MEVKFIKSKIFIACILLITLCSLTAIAASDVDNTVASANDENLTVQTSAEDSAVVEQSNQEIVNTEQDVESSQGDVLSASSDEEMLSGTQTQLKNLISNEGNYLELHEDYSVSSYISIYNKNGLVIDGKGHTIDANRASGIFNIASSCINMTFKNIKFINSADTAIVFEHDSESTIASFCFINCTFENNTGYNGAVIRATKFNGFLNIINSTSYGNSAYRGAFYYASSNAGVTNKIKLNIINSSFTENNVSGDGGSVYVMWTTDINIISSIFTRNHGYQGGAIRTNTDIKIDGSKFYSNEASYEGGCIFIGRSNNFEIKDSYFEGNSAYRRGGALFTYGATIENSNFVNNNVSLTRPSSDDEVGRGGVFFSRQESVTFRDCKFSDNVAREGGAISVDYRVATLSTHNCEFNNNFATDYGGAISSRVKGTTAVTYSKFNNNSARYGGAIATGYEKGITTGRFEMHDSDFTNNKASVNGGALHLETTNSVVDTSRFTDNTAYMGGAIYWDGNGGLIDNSNFESNTANNGVSVYWKANNGEITRSIFNENNPAGGAVYWEGTGGKISTSTFNGTKMIYIPSAGSVVLTSNIQNSSSYDGSSVYLEGKASFSLNEFMNAIYNKGVILSETYMTTLNNITVVTNVNSLPVFSRIEDDNGNPIKVDDAIIIFYDNGNQLTTTFNHTDYVSSVSNLAIGLHNFTSSGYKTANFNNIALKNGAILYLMMNLTVNQTNYGEKVVFTTTLINTTLNGTIDLHINDVVYNVPLINGVAELTLYNMAPNEYIVTAIYEEYNQTLNVNVTIDVQLRNSTINVTANNITYGGVVTINVTATNGTSGKVYIFVNNRMYTVTLKNSTAQLNLTNLPGGDYTVYAVYNGDVNFNGCNNNAAFSVTKQNVTINITAKDIEMGQTAIINIILPNDANGTSHVYVDGTAYHFTKQNIAFNVTSLTPGNHTVRVIYDGDDKYLLGSNSTTFEVKKNVIGLNIVAQDIYVGDNATIRVDFTGLFNATGLVLLTVNGVQYYTYANNTNATFVISNLPYGKYNVTATYLEDDIYYAANTSGSFMVNYVKINPVFNYSVDDDLNVIANVTVPIDANGDIIIEVDGKNYTSDIVKGKFSVPINGLEGGEYPVKIYFANDTRYLAVNTTEKIILKKLKPTIHIDSEHIFVGDNATITVRLPSDATGNVTITINNNNYTESIVNGSAVFNVSGLPHGNYTVVANYTGDRKYYANVEDEVLIVRKVDPNPYSYISVDDIFVGEIATFNITMPSDLTAKINLTVQGITHVVDIINGSGQINISDLKWGLPVPVHASFLGNDKYLGCERDYTRFSVHRITNYPINITATTNSTSANITVILPSDANGPGNITIDNRVFQVTYVNGKANVTVDELVSGQQYVVNATFAGDDKYTEGGAIKTLNSNKTLDYNFTAAAKDIVVGQTAYINVYLPNITNGTITIRVPGRTPYTINVNETFVNGTYDLPVYNLAAGSYTCYVTYNGNDMYEASTRSGTLVVSKINTSPGINFNTTYVGQNLTIQVTLPSDSNGTVNITIDGKVYNATVVNGTAYVNVPGLAADTYEASLFYSGNEKYNNRTQKFPVTILKVRDFLFDLGTIDIRVGDNETITIRLPSDIDVNVTITIPGTDYIDKVIQLTNGTATFNATGFKIGRYNVTASIKDSAKYIDRSVIGYFTVSAIDDYLFRLRDVNTTIVRDNITFVLELPEDATGNATVFIFGENYTAEVKNGVATIKVPTTAQGNYQFTISFEEEGKYVYKSQSGYAFVVKTNPNVNLVYNASVNVGESVTITFVLDKDATGNVSVTSRGVTYTAKLVNGTANVTINGYPVASAYSPHISYTGDDKYNPYSDTIKITAHKVSDYNITVNVSNITVDDVELVNISIPSDATEDVLVSGNFSNNTFSVKLNKGNATFIIKDLPAGTYFINVRYQGYQKYEDKNVTKIFRVDKVVLPIAIEFVNNDTIVVRLPELANGLANITVGDGLIKTQINITNGVGSLNISGIRPGNYSVNATFLGGARYLQNSTNITITIPKIKDYILPITVRDITVGENATITIVAPYNASGKMNLTINGGSVIEVQIINGIATYNATKLAVGNYTVVVSYEDEEYVYKTNSTKFQVGKIETVIQMNITGNSTSLTVNANLTESVYGGNLTITIDGTPVVFKDITSNMINLTVPALPGQHVVFIEYSGDENHTYKSDFGSYETFKIGNYTLTVDATDVITVLDTNTVIVTLPKGIAGEVNIYINDELYEEDVIINSTTGKATLVLDRLPSGNYTIRASFSSAIYELKENTTNFTVIKLNTTISVNVTNITKDLTEVINVTVNKNATGYVEIFINNVTFRVKVENGTAVLTRSNLVDKNYPIVVTYLGDDYYNINETTAEFTVSKIPVNITITCNDIVIGQEANFTIETSRNITDQVTVRIDNRNYTAVVYNGKGSLIVLGENLGVHNVTVFYAGDKDYLPANDTINVTVFDRLPTSISVNVTNITVGEKLTIYINVTGAQNGTVRIYMLGNPVDVKITNGTGNYTYTNLTARNYHFTAEYLENTYYKSSNTTGDFTVFKKQSYLTVNVTNIKVGEVEVFNITISNGTTGHVLISFADVRLYADINGTTFVSVPMADLPVGKYNVTVKYDGDENFYGSTNKSSFNITKLSTTITIDCNDTIIMGHPVEFTITTSANVTSVVTLNVDNKNYTTYIVNGKGTYTVYNLITGNYTATVYFAESDKYDAVENSTKFNVTGKSPIEISVSVDNITLGEEAIVYVKITNGTTGNVTLNIAGMPLTKAIVNGTVNFTVAGLIARDYHVTVTYFGDDNYLPGTNATDFTVYKKNSTISINVSNINVGQHEIINVTVTKGATGIVLIDIAGIQVYAEINATTGVATATFDDLGVNTYNVTATYLGDNNYNGSKTNATFNVTKHKTSIVINTTANIMVQQSIEFNITTSENITEVLKIEVDGVNYTAYIIGGKGSFILPKYLDVGDYTATVYYPGSSKYDPEQNTTDFRVIDRQASQVIVEISDITVGENATVYITVTPGATGTVILSIAGESYFLSLNNSKVNYTISNLIARNYHASVTYMGDEYYYGSENATNFVVNKKASQINVTTNNITVIQTQTISINITNGTTGVVLIDINGTDYFANITNGVAKLDVKNLAVGQYTVIVKYDGDANYNASSAQVLFNVTKLNSEITLELLTPSPVGEGDDVLIKVTGPDDFTGVAVVTVKGLNSKDYTVFINNGEGQLILTNQPVGTYNVSAKYIENDKYLANVSNNVSFEVYKTGSTLSVQTQNIYVGEEETIIVTVSGNYSDTVTIVIDNNLTREMPLVYNETTNSSVAKFVLSERFIAGVHNVHASFTSTEDGRIITYEGDSNFIVSKNNSTVGINSILDIKVGENVTITVTLDPSDATGNIEVYVGGEKYTVNRTNMTLTLKDLKAGHYGVQVVYEGDDKYLASHAESSFNVSKNNVEVRVDVSDIEKGQVEYINVTVAPDAKGYVLIDINGTKYYAEVIGGVARFNVIDLTPGKHDVNATFIGDDKYYSNYTTDSFNVSKLTTTIKINGSDIFFGQDEVFNITTSANLTVVVVIEVNGTNYTTFIKEGNGTFTVSKLPVGVHTATVYFNENTDYNAAKDTFTFEVFDKKESAIDIDVESITVGETLTVKVNVTDGATGDVMIVIAGNTYTRALENGEATFEIEGLTARNYHVSAYYLGDEYYKTSNNTAPFTVSKKNTAIEAVVTNSTVGSVEYITVTLNDTNASGNVLISVGGAHYYGELDNGVAKFNVTGLLVGNYTADIKYLGDDNFNNATGKVNLTIRQIRTGIIITGPSDIMEGQSIKLIIKTTENITSLVTVQIGLVNHTTFISQGSGELVLDNLTAGSYTAIVYYAGDEIYVAEKNQTTFVVTAKKPTELKIEVQNITIGETEKIIINVTKGATGNVTIVLAGKEYSRPIDANGQVVFEKEDLMARGYDVTVIYNGDSNYNGNRSIAHFTVSKKPSAVDLDVENITVGDTEIINVNVTSGATGMVLINVSGTYYYADLKDGKATFNVAGLKAGEYTAIVTYAGDDNYNRSVASKVFVVHPQVTLEPGVNNGTVTPITVKVSDNATGDVTVVVNGTPYTAKVENGTATVYVKDAQPGEQNVTVIYDDGKNPVTQNQTVDIPKVTGYDVNVTAPDVKVGENGTITVKLPEDATGNVTVKVGNQTIPAKVENGTAVVNVSDLPVGSYDVDVAYSGDDKYAGTNTKSHINVAVDIPTINAVEKLVRGWNSIYDYEAVFLDKFGNALEGVNVTFIVNGKSYTVLTEKHGVAKLTTSHLDVGEYNITSINPVTGESVTKELSVVPRLIHNKDITMDFMDGTYYTVLVIGDDGNPVGEGEIIDIYVNTIHYVSKTNKDGLAKLKINLNPTKYKVMAEYKNYKVYNKLVVKQTLKLVKKTVSVKKGKKIVLKAKLKWTNGKVIKGKKIVFKFKGKKYSAKTNKKGIAKVTIKKKSVLKKLKKGKKYSFTASYKTNKVKGKVKVKK